jgi:hypothetical protein
MNELDQPEGQEGQTAPEPGTKKVEGRDPKTVRLKREYETEVENKVASDYSHIIWAYGVIWAIFAIYGALLWRRASAQRADLETLRAKQNAS